MSMTIFTPSVARYTIALVALSLCQANNFSLYFLLAGSLSHTKILLNSPVFWRYLTSHLAKMGKLLRNEEEWNNAAADINGKLCDSVWCASVWSVGCQRIDQNVEFALTSSEKEYFPVMRSCAINKYAHHNYYLWPVRNNFLPFTAKFSFPRKKKHFVHGKIYFYDIFVWILFFLYMYMESLVGFQMENASSQDEHCLSILKIKI